MKDAIGEACVTSPTTATLSVTRTYASHRNAATRVFRGIDYEEFLWHTRRQEFWQPPYMTNRTLKSRPLMVELNKAWCLGLWHLGISAVLFDDDDAMFLAAPALQASPGIDRHLRHKMTMRFPEKGCPVHVGMDSSALPGAPLSS